MTILDDMADPFLAAEREFYRALNGFIEPLARSGALSPGPLNAGLVLLEVRGRSTGLTHQVPLVATVIGPLVIVATLRGNRSQWLRNLEDEPSIRYWLRGAPHNGTATVLRAGYAAAGAGEDPLQRTVRAFLQPAASAGWSFAIIAPASPGP